MPADGAAPGGGGVGPAGRPAADAGGGLPVRAGYQWRPVVEPLGGVVLQPVGEGAHDVFLAAGDRQVESECLPVVNRDH
ncbi:hypothetical protein CIT14_22195 [Virgibacillus profundi]|nr:hypothetical protein CIT14_22195 [Virgibacillus profundi]